MLLLLDEYGQEQRRTIGFKPVEYVFENIEAPALISGYTYKGYVATYDDSSLGIKNANKNIL
jgi:hypothetical protein